MTAGATRPRTVSAKMPMGVMYQTFLLAGAQALGVLTAPGPRRAGKEDVAVNPGDAADVVPYVAGRVRMAPHLITYFDFASKPVKNDTAIKEMALSGGISAATSALAVEAAIPNLPTGAWPPGKGAKVVEAGLVGGILGAAAVGLGQFRTGSYRYYLGRLFELCHGPIDAISGVYVDKRLVSNGGVAGSSFLIDDPQAWGGDHVDGGEYAMCDIITGKFFPEQQPNSYLVSQLGSHVTALSGKAALIIRGPSGYPESGYFAATAAGAPAMRVFEVVIDRWPNNLGVPEFKMIAGGDANPAECSFEWLRSPVFGVKQVPLEKIDIPSFQAGAETHFNDGVGYSDQFNARIDVETALDKFCAVGGAIIYGSFNKGTWRYKPIRRSYSIPSLPVFRRGKSDSVTNPSEYNVVRVDGFTPGTWASTVNEMQFEYTDRTKNFLRTTRYVRDPANFELTGKTKALSQELDGISNGDAAALVGTRELRAGSYPRPPITIFTNRSAYEQEPGDVVFYIDEVDKYEKVLRVAEVQELSSAETGEIGLICTEDQYGVGAPAFIDPISAPFVDPVGTATAAALAKVLEAPYYLGGRDDARLFVFAAKPNNAQINFDVYVSTDGGTNYSRVASNVDFAITGTITEAIPRLSEDTLDELTFTPSSTFDASRLVSATPTQIAAGANLIVFDDGSEFLAVEGISDNGDGTFSLTNIWRAVHPLDSVPSPHLAGARVWFFTYGKTVPPDEYTATTATKTKVTPRNLSATLDLADATAINLTVDSRSSKPNPVRGVQINGDYLTTLIGATDDLSATWEETNRLTEGPIIKQTEVGVIPEEDTTYTARFYATETVSVLLRTESGLTLPASTLTTVEEVASPNYLGHLAGSYRVEIDVIRDGLTSTTYIREVERDIARLLIDYTLPSLRFGGSSSSGNVVNGSFTIP